MVVGERGYLSGLNLVGLKRRGFERQAIHALRQAYRTIFKGDGEIADRIDAAAEGHGDDGPTGQLIAFLRQSGKRGVVQPRPGTDD